MPANRAPFVIIGVLVVVFAVVGLVGGAGKQSAPKSFVAAGSFRAVVVPTDAPRTVVVTPCNAPAPDARVGAARHLRTPGVTALRLQPGSGVRTVLVPRCAAAKGTQLNGTVNLPSAAFVLQPGSRPPALPVKPQASGVEAQVVVPSASRARTIVVPPCRAGTQPIRAALRQIVLDSGPRPATAVAPAC